MSEKTQQVKTDPAAEIISDLVVEAEQAFQDLRVELAQPKRDWLVIMRRADVLTHRARAIRSVQNDAEIQQLKAELAPMRRYPLALCPESRN